MAFTTPLNVIKFTHSTYADVRSESLGTGNGVETNFYVKNKPIWGSGSVSVYFGPTLQNSSTYTVDEELGKIQFTSAANNGTAVTAHYTYASISSETMNNFVNYADQWVRNIIVNTDNSTLMEMYTNFVAAHLLMKNLAALRARNGMTNYSIGYISVAKGDKEMEAANMYWNNFTNMTKLAIVDNTVQLTFRHPGGDEHDYEYFNRELVRDE